MVNVLIACTYPVNRGDELLLASVESALCEEFGDVTFQRTVLNTASAAGVDAMKQPLGLLMKMSVIMGLRAGAICARGLVPALLAWMRCSRRLPERLVRLVEPRAWTAIRRGARTSDVCVSAAGGYMLAENRDEWLWLSHLLTLHLVRSCNVRVVAAPCSIGPFHPAWNDLSRRLAGAYDHLTVRDDFSLELVRSMFDAAESAPSVQRTPDLGFAHPWRADTADGTVIGGRSLGVSVRYYRFGGVAEETNLRAKFESALIEAIDRLVDEFGCSVVFFPQDHAGMYSDAEYAGTIADRLRHRATVIDQREPIEQLIAGYASMDALIGVRMHACIMSLTVGTPVAPIAYEPKTYGAMHDFDSSMAILNIYSVTGAELFESVAAMWRSAPDRDAIIERADLVAQSSKVFASVARAAMLKPEVAVRKSWS